MNRLAWTAVASLVGATAFCLPIAASIYFSSQQSLEAEKDRALALAAEVLRRSDAITGQAAAAVARLRAGPVPANPCAPDRIALMRTLAVESSYLQLIGRVEGGKLVCSSQGRHIPPVPLGRVDYVSAFGVKVRVGVQLPQAPGVRLIVVERDGYAAAIHSESPLDVFLEGSKLSVALMSSEGRVIAARGAVHPDWLRPLPAGGAAKFFDGQYVVGLRRSRTFDITAIGAIPAAYVDSRTENLLYKLVPIGLLAGTALAWAVHLLLRQQASLSSIIRSSLRRGEFFVVYQPVVELQSGRCVGAEALVRWRRRGGEELMPDVFIPVAESSNQIEALTAEVIQSVERDLPVLLAEFPQLTVAVNLAPVDLHTHHIAQRLAAMFEKAGIRPHNLSLEVTERALVDFSRSGEIIARLRRMGVRVAIDDFGTGYSSLSYLTALEVDSLKIDKSFIDTIGSESATSNVVFYIIQMARALRLTMVAEGVETEEQAQFLREHGVEFAQGWLFGKPMPLDELRRFLGGEGQRARGSDAFRAGAAVEDAEGR